tara:strand:+ start:1015 stop:1278 length:264 start_codon:yes stop_codon:yes gene_type:complete
MRKNRKKQPQSEFKEVQKSLTLTERQALHQQRHPNDKNVRKEGKGVTWSKKTDKDKRLEEFYKTHTYAWVSETSKGWIALPIVGEEE